METLPYVIFNGRSSLDYGLLVTEKGSYKGARRDVSFVSVPGRNGDVLIDNGGYKNIKIPYKFNLLNKSEKDFSEVAGEIREWLLSSPGYFVLTDSYDKDYFRYASFSEEIDIEQKLRVLGTLSLSFSCKPFEYAFSGQNTVSFSAPGTIQNPKNLPAAPYVKIYGSGTVTLTVNEQSLVLQSINEFIELDFEMPNAYKRGENLNNLVVGDMSSFRLAPGQNAVSWSGAVQKIEMIPRWRRL